MNICVIDCSFFLSSLLPDEPKSDFVFADYSIHVPSIFFLECLNVLATALRKKRITNSQYEEIIDCFRTLPFIVDNFSSTQESLYLVSTISRENNLTSYDASYLELALRLKAPIGTLDYKMMEACKSEKIRIL